MCFYILLISLSTVSWISYHYVSVLGIQNAAARLISGACRHDHITPILATLHGLPVRQRVIFKAAVLTWKCLHDAAPRHLADRPLCAGGVYGRSSPVSLCSLRGPPGALDSDIYWPAQLCCVWPQDLEPTTNGPPITRTVARFIQAPAQDPLVCSNTRQCWLQLWVSCTVVLRCCDCTASSAPTTNVQTQLDSEGWQWWTSSWDIFRLCTWLN